MALPQFRETTEVYPTLGPSAEELAVIAECSVLCFRYKQTPQGSWRQIQLQLTLPLISREALTDGRTRWKFTALVHGYPATYRYFEVCWTPRPDGERDEQSGLFPGNGCAQIFDRIKEDPDDG